ncbi:MAG: pilus assembly protein [Gemmataceae bacterium]|nr:pilus assembly protein [Gemmataceae bacterium]
MRCRKLCQETRRGAAVAEMAVIVSLLVYLFVIGVDFARLFYQYQTITNCARSGAIYGTRDESAPNDTAGIEKTALADAKNLSPAPKVTSKTAVDDQGFPCLQVTVEWMYTSVTNFPGVPSSLNLSRTVQMRVIPTAPKNSKQANP